jgi:ATP-dependent DNA helicase RecQ
MFELRPFQKTALDALEYVYNRSSHVLCVAPTGSGKSFVYEKAAKTPDRRTLLVTPLIALARQQFSQLKRSGIPVSLGTGGSAEGPPESKHGIWIVSPEMLLFPSRKAALQKWRPNFLVVDECHCLWEWGEQFRPAFSHIPELLTEYQIPYSLWLTATLPFDARVFFRKFLPPPVTEVGGFNLPVSLHFWIQRVPWEDRAQALLHWIQSRTDAGLIFVATREDTYRVARLIGAFGKKVLTYHGGMSLEERQNAETLVLQQVPDVVVATSAFGMGMDYPHLSYVILWQAPTSILSLVQTMGRVGRSGQKEGHALVFWDLDDFKTLEWTVGNSEKRRKELMDLLVFFTSQGCRKAKLKEYFDRTSEEELCQKCDFCAAQTTCR